MWKNILILLILLVPSYVFAVDVPFSKDSEVSIAHSFFTEHINRGAGLNENNEVIVFSIDNYFITTFNNSYYKRSVAFGYAFRTKKYNLTDNKNLFVRLNIYTGFLYGYKDHMPTVKGWTVSLAPTFEIGFKPFAIETMTLPIDSGVLVSLFKIRFQ